MPLRRGGVRGWSAEHSGVWPVDPHRVQPERTAELHLGNYDQSIQCSGAITHDAIILVD